VAFGGPPLPAGRAPGPFTLALPSGLRLTGQHAGGGLVERLQGELCGRPLGLPARALVEVSPDLSSVAAGAAAALD
jgi:hypothetical protein